MIDSLTSKNGVITNPHDLAEIIDQWHSMSYRFLRRDAINRVSTIARGRRDKSRLYSIRLSFNAFVICMHPIALPEYLILLNNS